MKESKSWKHFNFDTSPLLPLQGYYYFSVDAPVSVFQLGEASKHGFADSVLVRVRSGQVVVCAFGAESCSLRSQLSLRGERENSTPQNSEQVVVQ